MRCGSLSARRPYPVGGKCHGACSLAVDTFVCDPVTTADPPSSGEGSTDSMEWWHCGVLALWFLELATLKPGALASPRPTDRFTTLPDLWGWLLAVSLAPESQSFTGYGL